MDRLELEIRLQVHAAKGLKSYQGSRQPRPTTKLKHCGWFLPGPASRLPHRGGAACRRFLRRPALCACAALKRAFYEVLQPCYTDEFTSGRSRERTTHPTGRGNDL